VGFLDPALVYESTIKENFDVTKAYIMKAMRAQMHDLEFFLLPYHQE
jgi:hypothetical protein